MGHNEELLPCVTYRVWDQLYAGDDYVVVVPSLAFLEVFPFSEPSLFFRQQEGRTLSGDGGL